MKKLRLFCLALTVIIASAFTLTACGGGGGDDGGDKGYIYKGLNVLDNLGASTGTIKFHVAGGSVELDLWDRLITAFETENPGIKIEKVTISDDDALFTALAGGNAPDVIQVKNTLIGNWAKQGALQSIQPFIKRDSYDLSDFWENIPNLFSFNTEKGIRGDGDMFALPKDLGVNGIFVNRTLINQAKSAGRITQADYNKITDQVNPMTFDEYLAIAKKLTVYDSATPANSIYGTNRIYWESYLWSLGDDILTSDYQLNTGSADVKKVFEYSKNMVTKGHADFCAPYSSASSVASQGEQDMFLTGKIAMYWSGRWTVPAYDAADMDYYCIPVPVAVKSDGSKGESIGWCSTVGYAISRNSKKTEMAWKFIQFMASEEGYRIMNQLNYNVPGRMSLITETQFANPVTNGSNLDAASAKLFFDMAEVARVNNSARFTSPRWIDAFEAKLALYFTNEISDVNTFLNTTKNEVNAAIKSSDPQLFT